MHVNGGATERGGPPSPFGSLPLWSNTLRLSVNKTVAGNDAALAETVEGDPSSLLLARLNVCFFEGSLAFSGIV